MRVHGVRWFLIFGLGFAGAVGAETLESRVDAVVSSPGFEHGHWGILVVDGKSGKPVFERNADHLFCPASVTKLFSTAAALVDLGADYRFQTPVVRRGEIEKGTLKGDLILVAQGDLCLGGRTGPDGALLFKDHDHTYAGGNLRGEVVACDPVSGLDQLAREIVSSGIKTISGDVLIDDRLFEPERSTGSGPTRVSPILINDNLIDVEAAPSTPGEPAAVRLIPQTAFATADIQVETVSAGESPVLEVHPVGPRRFRVRGRVPAGHKPLVKVYEVEEPAGFARTLLIEALRRRGVHVDAAANGENSAERLPARSEVAKLPKVAEYISPPLREYVRVILKVSHNLHASTLPLLIAAHHGERTLEQGLRREAKILKGLGVDPAAVSFGGGAGGARADLVSPRATTTLLRAMADRPDARAFDAALPVLGLDGTLAEAVPTDSPARGHARAKTGTYWVENGLSGKAVLTSKALAGYLETENGRSLVICFFVNNVPLNSSTADTSEATAAAGKLLGKLCEIFYSAETGAQAQVEGARTAR